MLVLGSSAGFGIGVSLGAGFGPGAGQTLPAIQVLGPVLVLKCPRSTCSGDFSAGAGAGKGLPVT